MNQTIDYKELSDEVYNVDRGKSIAPIKEKDLVVHERFQVLKVTDNTENGMQAMAVAPVVNGKADLTHITVVYAGTNFSDHKDIAMDAHSVILGTNSAQKTEVIDGKPFRTPIASQIDTALAFANEVKSAYPHATIDTTGHSLGGFLSLTVGIKNRWHTTVFNAPSAHRFLTDAEREWVKHNSEILVNYRNPEDWIGNFGGDPLGIVHMIVPYQEGQGIMYAHGLATWQFDSEGRVVDKFGKVVHANRRAIDIDGDGAADVSLLTGASRPRNLLALQGYATTHTPILLDPTVLRNLANNLRQRTSEDLSEMKKLCRLCIEKNAQVASHFSQRKQHVSESIKEVLRTTGLASLFYDLQDTVGVVMKKRTFLEQGAQYAVLQYPFRNTQTPFISGAVLPQNVYNKYLLTFQRTCEDLLAQVRRQRSHWWSDLFPGAPTLLTSWDLVEQATGELLYESDRLFEGKGLRFGKQDGIPESLTTVLSVIEKNTEELTKQLLSLAEMAQGIADNFDDVDRWLGRQLAFKEAVGTAPAVVASATYQAYLERDEVFQDVTGVLQAFDWQVEENSRTYAQKINAVYHETLEQLERGLNRWVLLGEDVVQAARMITESYAEPVMVQEAQEVSQLVGNQWVMQTTYPVHYWGRLESLYPRQVVETISDLETTIFPTFDQLQQVIWRSQAVRQQLSTIEGQLTPIVEEGVYHAFDLDEIVAGQQAILRLATRLNAEVSYVLQVITDNGMQAQAIQALRTQLAETQRIIAFYAQFVGDCFGQQNTNTFTVPQTWASVLLKD